MATQVQQAVQTVKKAERRPEHRSWSWVAPLVIVLLFMGLDLKVLSAHNWEPRAFVLETPDSVSADQGWGVGYDGRFAYHIAVNPWGFTVGLDAPNYRYQRIVFPALVKLFSLGHPEAVPWAMLGLNLFAAGLGTYALAILLQRKGASALFSIIVPVSLGYMLAMRTNLLEPLALAFGLAGWLAYELDRRPRSLLLFALAGLTKEFALIFPAALVLWELRRWNFRSGLQIGAAAFLPYSALYMILWAVFGNPEEALAKGRLMLVPFSGFKYLTDPTSRAVILMWVVVPAILAGVLTAFQLWRFPDKKGSKEAFLVLVSVALISVLPQMTWVDPLAIIRFGLGFLAAFLLWLAAAYPRALPYAAALWAPSGLILALVPGMF